MKIHILGVCGTMMAGIARLAAARGDSVAGSDAAFYPPMDAQLRAVRRHVGYDATCARRRADLYIVGNAIRRGNPLMESILNARRPFVSAPQWLQENILRGRRVAVVAGTHGKTTTAAMLAWILESAGRAPGFLIGGVAPNFGVSARLGGGDVFVVEGDEYDCAFFDKRPKFLHFRPELAALTNLEYDHSDIYPDAAAIVRQFHYLLRALPADGLVVANADSKNLRRAIAQGCWTPMQGFGKNGEWRARFRGGMFTIVRDGEAVMQCRPLFAGAANRANALAAVAAAAYFGIKPQTAAAALATFRPPARRLELIAAAGGIKIYDDFAHHPTAIAAALAALRETAPAARILAAFEPRSNTMRAGVWAGRLAAAFAANAAKVFALDSDLQWSLKQSLAPLGRRAQVFRSTAALAAAVLKTARPGDCIVLLSNGDFGGLRTKLAAAISSDKSDN